MSWRFSFSAGRVAVLVAIGVAALLVHRRGRDPDGDGRRGQHAPGRGRRLPVLRDRGHPPARGDHGGQNSIPANYLALFKRRAQYGVPWVCSPGSARSRRRRPDQPAGSASGRTRSARPGHADRHRRGVGNTWGGAPVHPASEVVSGVATDDNGDGVASVYEPADAIAGAAKYLLEHGVQNNVTGPSSPTTTWSPTSRPCSTGLASTPGRLHRAHHPVSAPECLTSAQTTACRTISSPP